MYTLPKIWQERVPKYWDKFMPSNYPNSSSEFSFKFDTEEEKAAVETFEDQLGTEESVVPGIIGEGNFMDGYYGTYDVKGEAGTLTLLSPEKIKAENIAALHLEDGEWKKVEDATLVDGYVWGTLESFSPIAIISYKREIEVVQPDFMSSTWIVANGNPVQVYTDEADNAIKVKNLASGKVIELGGAQVVCGGSIDGSVVDTTTVKVLGVTSKILAIYAGSYCWDNSDETVTTTNKSCNVSVFDSKIRAVTGAGGRTRVDELNILIKNSTLTSHLGTGESYNTKAAKDANKDGTNLGFGSAYWLKKANIVFEDGSYTPLLFTGGNTGYTYTDNANLVVADSKVDYVVAGGSNGRSNVVNVNLSNLDGKYFQTNNRGTVDSVSAKIADSTIPNLFVFGDATDSTVTGITGEVAIDINKGTYGIKLGTQGGTAATSADAVKFVKYSRSANITISAEDTSILGNKLISK